MIQIKTEYRDSEDEENNPNYISWVVYQEAPHFSELLDPMHCRIERVSYGPTETTNNQGTSESTGGEQTPHQVVQQSAPTSEASGADSASYTAGSARKESTSHNKNCSDVGAHDLSAAQGDVCVEDQSNSIPLIEVVYK